MIKNLLSYGLAGFMMALVLIGCGKQTSDSASVSAMASDYHQPLSPWPYNINANRHALTNATFIQADDFYGNYNSLYLGGIPIRMTTNGVLYIVFNSQTNNVLFTTNDITGPFTELDPVWNSSSDTVWNAINGKQPVGDYATGTPVYVETDPIWANDKASGFAVGGPIGKLEIGAFTNICTNGVPTSDGAWDLTTYNPAGDWSIVIGETNHFDFTWHSVIPHSKFVYPIALQPEDVLNVSFDTLPGGAAFNFNLQLCLQSGGVFTTNRSFQIVNGTHYSYTFTNETDSVATNFAFSGFPTLEAGHLEAKFSNVTISVGILTTNLYVLDESDPVWANDKANGFTMGGIISMGNTNIENVARLKLNTNTPSTGVPGQLSWNNTDGVADIYSDVDGVINQVGEELWIRGYNKEEFTISNGWAVCFPSAGHGVSGKFDAYLAHADIATNNRAVALATHDVAPGAYGIFTAYGKIRGLDTSKFHEGHLIYLSTNVNETGFNWTTNPIAGEGQISPVVLGRLMTSNKNQGVIFVRPVLREEDYVWRHDSNAVWNILNSYISTSNQMALVTNDFPAGTRGVLVTDDGGTNFQIITYTSGMDPAIASNSFVNKVGYIPSPYMADTGSVGSVVYSAFSGNSISSTSHHSQILGGTNNSVDEGFGGGTIVGGYGNKIINSNYGGWGEGYSFIGGGKSNAVSGGYAAVVMGQDCVAGYRAFVGSGYGNKAYAAGSVICGGGWWTGHEIGNGSVAGFIGGGRDNVIGVASTDSIIVGGLKNSMGNNLALVSILGGEYNSVASGAYGLILEGSVNYIGSRDFCAIMQGNHNRIEWGAYSSYDLILNGYYNKIEGSQGGGWGANTIINGFKNYNHSVFGFIGSGYYNAITNGNYTTIINGYSNTVDATTNSIILAGSSNLIRGAVNSTILGGDNLIITNSGVLAFGTGAKSTAPSQIVFQASGGMYLNDLKVVTERPMVIAKLNDATTQVFSALSTTILAHTHAVYVKGTAYNTNTFKFIPGISAVEIGASIRLSPAGGTLNTNYKMFLMKNGTLWKVIWDYTCAENGERPLLNPYFEYYNDNATNEFQMAVYSEVVSTNGETENARSWWRVIGY